MFESLFVERVAVDDASGIFDVNDVEVVFVEDVFGFVSDPFVVFNVDDNVDSRDDVFADVNIDVVSLDDHEIVDDVLDDGSLTDDRSLSTYFLLRISKISHLLIM